MKHNSKQVDAIAAYIADVLTNDQIIAIHNEFCDKHGNPDDIIYQMGEYGYICEGMDIDDLARMQYYGEFNPNDDYFCFDGRGNLASFSSYDDDESPIYLSELAECVIDYGADEIESNELIPAFLEFCGIANTDNNAFQIGDALLMSGDDLITSDWDELKKSLYRVGVWCGAGYALDVIFTLADNDETAIERAMVHCQNEERTDLYITPEEREKDMQDWTQEEREREEENSEFYFYVDPTFEDSQCVPAYFRTENLRVEQMYK